MYADEKHVRQKRTSQKCMIDHRTTPSSIHSNLCHEQLHRSTQRANVYSTHLL